MNRICDIEYCDREAEKSRTKCIGHRRRLHEWGWYGDEPIKRIPPKGLGTEGLLRWNGWDVTDGDCWEYRGPRFANGYGQIKVLKIPRLAHRVAYELWVSQIPEGLVIRHKCDNKPCINPDHLETGTVQDNVRDRDQRGRTANGNRGKGKLTDSEALDVRLTLAKIEDRIIRGKEYERLAEEYGVSKSSIQNIHLGKNYRHVGGFHGEDHTVPKAGAGGSANDVGADEIYTLS